MPNWKMLDTAISLAWHSNRTFTEEVHYIGAQRERLGTDFVP